MQLNENMQKVSENVGNAITVRIQKRMMRAYPNIKTENIKESVRKNTKKEKTVFAEGCCFFKIFWLFLIGAFIGDLMETLFCRYSMGRWMSRSSVVYGPFSIVWGLGCAMFTALLYKYKEKSDRYIFMLERCFMGLMNMPAAYLPSWFSGRFSGITVSYLLTGGINLLFAFLGIAAVVWLKIIYPKLSNLIEKIPIKTGNILTWILILFMIFNAGMSTLALNRYNQRQQGSLQKTPQMTAAVEDSRTDLEKFLDKHFPDKRMEQIYPNAKIVVDGKPVSQKDMKEKRKSS